MIRKILAFLRIPGFRNPKPVVAVIRLAGVIGNTQSPIKPGLNLANQVQSIERAFKLKNLKAVALAINSPGGSPVQSTLIFKRIRALADENDIPVIAFAEDVAASGGYMLACAGDEIFADDSSVIGSIGVISAGFGFPQVLAKLGIERRVYTAGRNKGMLDPFKAEDPEDVERLKALQEDVYSAFADLVRARRGSKLTKSEDELFTGEFWTGRKALEFGLIDGLGDLTSVMQERYGERVRFVPVTQRQSWLKRRMGMTGLSTQPDPLLWADGLLRVLEERALWGRFGL